MDRSLIVSVSEMLLSLNFSSSSSTALSLAFSWPFARNASARSLFAWLKCSLEEIEARVGSGGFAIEVADDALAAFSASNAAVRSASRVSMHDESYIFRIKSRAPTCIYQLFMEFCVLVIVFKCLEIFFAP